MIGGSTVNGDGLEALRGRFEASGRALPRIALFLFGARDGELLAATLERIPEAAAECLEQIVVMEDQAPGPLTAAPSLRVGSRELDVLIHRAPSELGYGGVRKAAFEYALLRDFEVAVFLRAGVHPPEALTEVLRAVLEDPQEAVWASRLVDRRRTFKAGMPLARLIAHTVTTGLQNRVLGLRLRDYHSGFRALPMRALRSIPFQLNSDDRSFDMQLTIQCRVLGLPIREVEVPPSWREFPTDRLGLRGVARGVATAIDYRLHQLHATRRGRYLVDRGVHYTFKRSSTGSHVQIVERIRPGSLLLDLGCSQGLLARPLQEKGVRVTGVDSGPEDRVASELEAYYLRDLEQPLELPTGRVFDYVVSSDVIEHLRQRGELLRSVRRYLKPEGRLLISTGNVALWFYRLSLLVGRFEYGPRGILDETHVRLYTRATFRREVENAGFRVVDERVTALPFELVFESTGRSRAVRTLARLYHLLARLWPELFAYQFILEAEITTLDDEATAPPSDEGRPGPRR